MGYEVALVERKKVLEKIRVYWDKETNNGADYLKKNHPTMHYHQMRPQYIHTSNLVRKMPLTIRLCEGVLN